MAINNPIEYFWFLIFFFSISFHIVTIITCVYINCDYLFNVSSIFLTLLIYIPFLSRSRSIVPKRSPAVWLPMLLNNAQPAGPADHDALFSSLDLGTP